ncbi:uncharacterized protein LOC108029006 isoform X1 [Drosophila biarmipes]|uniref:uncharacterized protein LOC108029006 isoform X1 n=1 Tax=Drosophila biarmipes TaxID=125945 RepID=UPI0007E73317|nr:uncharacterized protein LOC108029006 isoform X1 [Drosophila biarmipes]
MQLLLVLFLVSATLGNKKGLRCLKTCPVDVFDVSCSFDKFCYFEAENNCHVEIEKCMRKAYNKPDFIKKKPGYCLKQSYPKRARPCIPMVSSSVLPVKNDFVKKYNRKLFATRV